MLPSIFSTINYDSQHRRYKIHSISNRLSEKKIRSNQENNKQRYFTEQGEDKKYGYVGKKLMNYISFDKVKNLKNNTKICLENMGAYQKMKYKIKGNQLESKRLKQYCQRQTISPRGLSVKIHLKTQHINNQQQRRKFSSFQLKKKIKTQIVQNLPLKKRLKQQMKDLQNDCQRIKKYSHVSIRQTINKHLSQSKNKIKKQAPSLNHKKIIEDKINFSERK